MSFKQRKGGDFRSWIPRSWRTTRWAFGWHHLPGLLLLLGFGVQAFTGALLAFYYRPTVERAFESVNLIRYRVFLGEVIHSVHHWGAYVLMGLAVLHGLGILVQRDYLRLRGQWLVGTGLLVLLVLSDVTGHLLPWSQTALWTTVRALEEIRRLPGLGALFSFLVGGTDVTQDTLTRFYFLHVSALPGLFIALTFTHVYVSLRSGLRRLSLSRPVYPDWVHWGLSALLLWVGGLTTLAVLAPPLHPEVADVLHPPPVTRAPWYFRPLQWLEPRTPGWVLGWGFLALLAFWTLLPWLDDRRRGTLRWWALMAALGYIALAWVGSYY